MANVLIRNNEARIHHLPGLTLTPGVNSVDEAVWAKASEVKNVAAMLESVDGKPASLELVDGKDGKEGKDGAVAGVPHGASDLKGSQPFAMRPPEEQTRLVKETFSKPLLESWSKEKLSPETTKAIHEQLAKLKTEPQAGDDDDEKKNKPKHK